MLLRDWRQRRHVSQLELAGRAGVSSRHVSFIETGRSRPTSQMILRLCDHLAVPLREQNRLLLAGGFAPAHPERDLADPPMAAMHEAIEAILAGHLPYPALVVDGGWELVAANQAVYGLLDGLDPELLEPPVNVIRLTLDPRGLAPRIRNLDEWREQLLLRIGKEYADSGDARLGSLLADFAGTGPGPTHAGPALVVPLEIEVNGAQLSFISTTTVFGTPREVTLSELAIEAFYPADAATRAALS